MKPAIRIGTSGWHYNHWRGNFYPEGLPSGEWLRHYLRSFDTVELNATFYRLPKPETATLWRRQTPPGFLFAVKASRFITHIKRLGDPKQTLKLWLNWTQRLKERLGPLLIQLPPRWHLNLERLAAFLKALPPRRAQYVMEFRDPTWFTPEVYALLKRHDVSLCIYHLKDHSTPEILTSRLVYVRFHGLAKYGGNYPTEFLKRWAEKIDGWRNENRQVYAYFNNDVGGFAPKNALELRRMLER
jgi:uncharacterized protein YecE (DUF72 family)